MIKKDVYLTNSRLKNKFYNNFDLANYAIEMARSHMNEREPLTLQQIIEDLENLADIEKDTTLDNNTSI